MRYRLGHVILAVAILAALSSYLGYVRRLHIARQASITHIRDDGGMVLLKTQSVLESIVFPPVVRDVDISIGIVDQNDIDEALSLNPTERLVLPCDCDVSEFDLSGLRDLDSRVSVEHLPAENLCDVNRRVRGLRLIEWQTEADGYLTHKQEDILREFTNLSSLKIRIDASELPIVEQLSSLEWLSLGTSDLQGASLAGLAKLPQLRSLNLSNCKGINDDSIVAISDCENLTELYLGDTAVTADCLHALMQISNLQVLDVSLTEVSSEDIKTGWPSLKVLFLDSAQLKCETSASLEKRLPGVETRVGQLF